MHASLTTFKTMPGKRAEVEGLASNIFPVMKGLKGFKSVVYFGDYDTNECGALYTWETKEDSDAAYDLIKPKLQEVLGPLVIEPPVRKVYEVFEP